MPGAAPGAPLSVVDCGKRDDEHFDFNRGILCALKRRRIAVRFFGMGSVQARHADVLGDGDHQTFAWPEERAGTGRLATILFKLSTTRILALVAASRSRRVLVLYATPVCHLLLALWSRLGGPSMTVFLHAEVEFVALPDRGGLRVGPRLMTLALRLASARLVHLVLTRDGAARVQVRRTQGHVRFCPHPMSPELLVGPSASPTTETEPSGCPALLGAKPDADLRWLAPFLAEAGRLGVKLNVNGAVCVAPDQTDVPSTVESLRTCRHHLARQQFEAQFRECRVYLVGAAVDAYPLSVSGPACLAASTGCTVVGAANRFMCDYATLYPAHFRVGAPAAGPLKVLAAEPRQPLDNLSEVAEAIACAFAQAGAA